MSRDSRCSIDPAQLRYGAVERELLHSAAAGRYGLLLAALALLAVPLFLRLAYRSNRYALVAVLGAALVAAGIAPLSVPAQDRQAVTLALLGCGMLLMFGTNLVLAQRAVRAGQFRLGALPGWKPAPIVACLAASGGALAAGVAAHAYGPAAAAAAAGSLSLMGGAVFMLLYLLSSTIKS